MILLLSQSIATTESLASLFEMLGERTPHIFAVLPALIAVILFFSFRKTENKALRLLPYVVLGLGVILGILAYVIMSDQLYMSTYLLGRSGKTMVMRAIPIVPIVTAILIFFLSRKGERGYSDQL